MNKRIIDYLQSVEISHSFAMKYNHWGYFCRGSASNDCRA
jgi:hypothetical protein